MATRKFKIKIDGKVFEAEVEELQMSSINNVFFRQCRRQKFLVYLICCNWLLRKHVACKQVTRQ